MRAMRRAATVGSVIVEHIFAAEARLRRAAESYAAWIIASNRTEKTLNEARAELRAAAVAYGELVRKTEGARK